MTASHTARDRFLPLRSRLFAPGERLGWIFRDRWRFVHPFNEPAPLPQSVPDHLVQQAQIAIQKHKRRVTLAGAISGGLFMFFFLLGACAAALGSSAEGLVAGLALGIVLAVPGAVVIGVSLFRRWTATSAVQRAEQQLRQQYQQQAQYWQERKTAHERNEYARVDQLDEWGAARTPQGTRRIDIFGGNLWSWEAFLTVYGTSVLAERPLIVIDLSRETVCRELAGTARAAQVPVDAQLLPAQLAETTLLSGLAPRQLVDALIESMYGDDPNAARADRSMDNRILTKVVQALGEDLSMGRLAAGLRALMDEPDDSGYLTRSERNHIADELFSAEHRQQARPTLSRMESYIEPLETLGTQRTERGPAYLTCIALDSEARNVRSELLTDIIVQWLTHRITTEDTHTPSVIIAGADELARRHLERLSDACERRHVHLTLLFRHLRETGLNVLGGGAVGFMKLGSYQEATHAADFIGRQHKFELSQLTKTLGGNETHTTTETEGESETEGISVSTAVGWATNWSKGASTSYRADGLFGGSLFGDNRTGTSRTSSTGGSRSTTNTRSKSWSTTRNWSTAYSYADGTNWSDAASTQRVYEYTVEPTELQALPDYALLLVGSRTGRGPRLFPVECDPAIVTLPRVSTDPLPELPLPPQMPPASVLQQGGYPPGTPYQHYGQPAHSMPFVAPPAGPYGGYPPMSGQPYPPSGPGAPHGPTPPPQW